MFGFAETPTRIPWYSHTPSRMFTFVPPSLLAYNQPKTKHQRQMGINNDKTIEAAQTAYKLGDKRLARELLFQSAHQDPNDHRPWLLLVGLAPSQKTALIYLDQAKRINPQNPSIERARGWIEKQFDSAAIESSPPGQGRFTRIRVWLKGAPLRIPLLYLAFLALAETITTLGDPRWGMLFHGVCLVSLILHGSLFSRNREQHFLLGLSLSPLIRLLSMTMPLPEFPFVYWYMVVGIPLFLATYILIRITGLTNVKIGFNARAPVWQILIGSTGILLGYLEYLILRPEPLVAELRFDLILIPALILLIFTGFLEELIFRGVFQYFSIRFLGRWGLFYVAVVFAVLHLGYHSALDVIFVFFVALFFGFVANRTGSILGVTLSHGITNIVLFLIFPFIVSVPLAVPENQDIYGIYTQPENTTPIVPLIYLEKEPLLATEQTPSFVPMTETPVPGTVNTALSQTPAFAISPQPTLTPSLKTCSQPVGWEVYTVRTGDTLSSIRLAAGVTVAELQEANCLGSSTFIWVGQQLFVPVIIYQTITPWYTPTPTP